MVADPIFWGSLSCALAGGILLGSFWRQRTTAARKRRWPQRWSLSARPLFNIHERALFKELRATLPHHVVLAKVSLLRFCQSADPADAKAWYERLQALHVSMVICTPAGQVISAIDIERGGQHPKRASSSQKLKEAVLEACRVRYVRCLPGQWPLPHLLPQWALGQTGHPLSAPLTISSEQLHDVGDQLARKLRQRRAERTARWSESGFSQDSFFAFDSRFEGTSTLPSDLPTTPLDHDKLIQQG